jgi:alanyl-tRNA synthetase
MIKKLSTNEIRSLFIEFFKKNNHTHLKSSNLIPENDQTALFANSGMFQFKDIFTGKLSSDWSRVVTSQKCLRVGGKHNDLENVGFTARHHTFFEMLGNFSFGDYFKKEAISFAWKFLTEELLIPKEKLVVTVFHEDYEAIEIWKEVSNFDDSKIIRISTKDNFWEMGDSGPCGPCSEIFYDYGPSFKGGLPGSKEQDEGERYIEIWNLVFMQYERINGELLPLPKKSIDTGMGLERIAAVCQDVHDNYQTDIFLSIINEFKNLINKNFEYRMQDAIYIAARVAADHIRSSAFLISEGLNPSNTGREYILKRIIRRVLVFLYKINAQEENILSKLSKKLIDLMSSVYPELNENKTRIQEVLNAEEELFFKTIKNGINEFNLIMKEKYSFESESLKLFLGEDIFKLYDTFGFPVDLTEDMVFAQGGFLFDREGFEKLMEKQKELGKKSWKGSLNYNKENNDFYIKIQEKFGDTKFVGYDENFIDSELIGLVQSKSNQQKKFFIFTKTPIYYESGGQASDTGFIFFNEILCNEINEKTIENECFYISDKFAEIVDVKKYFGIIVHECYIFDKNRALLFDNILNQKISNSKIIFNQIEFDDSEFEFFIFDKLNKNPGENDLFKMKISFDEEKRNNIRKNHTCTHILHSVLKRILGGHISQKGSSVNDSRFRFDFNFQGPISESKLYEIENMVNKIISQNINVQTSIMKREDAIKEGAMALFDEKYSEIVRTLRIFSENIGGKEDFCFEEDDRSFLSLELCGGTHVKNTSEILAFKILSEESVASGVRRIEGVTGLNAIKFLNEFYRNFMGLIKTVNVKKDDFSTYVQNIIKTNKEYNNKILDLEKSIILNKLLILEKLYEINFENHKIDLYFFSEDAINIKNMKNAMFDFCEQKKNSILLSVSKSENKDKLIINFLVMMNQKYFTGLFSAGLNKEFEASKILLKIYNIFEIQSRPSGGGFFASGGVNKIIDYQKISNEFKKIFSPKCKEQ